MRSAIEFNELGEHDARPAADARMRAHGKDRVGLDRNSRNASDAPKHAIEDAAVLVVRCEQTEILLRGFLPGHLVAIAERAVAPGQQNIAFAIDRLAEDALQRL